MYIEFLLLIFDYFRTLTRRIIFFEIGLPLLFTTITYCLDNKINLLIFKSFKDSAINILGVLLGFSIAIITILTTGSGKNLDNIRAKKTAFVISGKQITLFELILINFTYSVVLEIFTILSSLTAPIIGKIHQITPNTKIILYLLFISFVLHILLLTLRNLTDFYLVITKKTDT